MSDPSRSVERMEALVFTVQSDDAVRSGMPMGMYVVHYWPEDGTADLLFKPVGSRTYGPSVPVTRIEEQRD